MDSIDLDVLNACHAWLLQGRRVMLVTVVSTWGSSPRPEGAMLAIRDDGFVVGSVSGGCIEDDLIAQVQRDGLAPAGPRSVTYGVSAEEANRFGLPCGGTMQLVLEPLTLDSGISSLRAAVSEGKLIARTLDMLTGQVRLEPLRGGVVANVGMATAAVDDGAGTRAGVRYDGRELTTLHGPRYRMLVIGDGQLSRYLCDIAVGLGYRVTVCDPREEYDDRIAREGIERVTTMPDDTVIAMQLDAHCAVIALTHDPKLDDLALMEALRTPAFYVGALGSRKNNAARRERLLEFDLSAAQIARLHGPAGLFIGSRTPPEIALSILAEVTAIRNGVYLPGDFDVGTAKTRTRPRSEAGGSACAMQPH